MQKIGKKGSVLIWAIFLSLVISISFISISTKITKNLKNSSINNKAIEENIKINEILKTSEKNVENIGNKTIFISNKKLDKSLKNNERFVIDFEINSIINLDLITSSLISYELIGTKTDSGILTGSLNNYETGIGKLELINHSGYTKFTLLSDNKFEIGEKNYKIIENIGSKKIIRNRGVLK